MNWPFVSRTVHRLEVESRDARIAELQEQATYWRTRAERLTDAALARAGAIHEPTMVNRPAPPPSLLGTMMSSLNITEIDSSKDGRP